MTEILRTYSPQSLVGRALAFAEEAHRGVTRKTGDPYLTHCLEVATTVREWGLDDTSIAAALLHDVVEDTSITLKHLESRFGGEVASIVDGLTKLKRLTYPTNDPNIENLRKFVVSFCRDLRVLLIKLADRLHNMQTLGSLAPEDQRRIAWETLEIYGPLAYRLGMQRLSGELDDLAFPFAHPDEYRWLMETVKASYDDRLRYAEELVPVVQKTLKRNGIPPIRIDARAKRYYSLFRKLQRYDMNLDKIYDLVALRIIVKTVEECYAALGAIHQLWAPLANRFKDHIARPKQNGYRSLHTTVFATGNTITEFQIRTQEMHEEAELGIAAHWGYQQIKDSKRHTARWRGVTARRELIWVEQLRNWQKTFTDQEEFVQTLKTDFFKDRIFVATPQNDIIDLPVGATPIDFAYRIHSEIGDSCTGAKVNGKIVPLDIELKSGDIVEIMVQRGKKPSEDWLSFIKTELARKHIKSALREKVATLRRRVPGTVEFHITNVDRTGYLEEVTRAFANQKINITFLESKTDSRGTFSTVTVRCSEVPSSKLERLLVRLKNIKGTHEVSHRFIR